jgi:hypothetical protein
VRVSELRGEAAGALQSEQKLRLLQVVVHPTVAPNLLTTGSNTNHWQRQILADI